mmetsp:Transcript_22961/g.55613  ORF Transcript_22961/g.55613 Transcript_22961/m.55613 type:complete len:203 (+) Transcript_22961:565-1173(+)
MILSGMALPERARSRPNKSMPTKSFMRKGPMRMPNSSAAASMLSGMVPFWSNSWAPDTPITRLATNPGQLPTRQVIFLIFFPNAIAVAMVRALLLDPRTFSSNFMTLAGEKKWHPITSSGRLVADAISSMSSPDVLEAKMHPGLQTLSNSAKISFLIFMFSNTASITKSHCAKSSYLVDGLIRARILSTAACFLDPRSTLRA